MNPPATRFTVALAVTTFLAGCAVPTGTRASAPTPSPTLTVAISPAVSPRPVIHRQPRSQPRLRPRPPAGLPLAGTVVVLDPGHNGANWAHPEIIDRLVDAVTLRKPCDTTGSQTDSGYPESAFTFDVAIRVRALLVARGARVVLTRPNNAGVGPCITDRATIGNVAHANVAISIHADGGPASGEGFHVIAPAPVGPNDGMIAASWRFAELLRNVFTTEAGESFANYTATAGLAVRSDLGGLNLSVVPKVFIECANLRNAVDAARVMNPAWRERAAAAIADAISSFLRDDKDSAR